MKCNSYTTIYDIQETEGIWVTKKNGFWFFSFLEVIKIHLATKFLRIIPCTGEMSEWEIDLIFKLEICINIKKNMFIIGQ